MFTTSVVSVISIVLLYSYSTSVHCASVDPDSHDCLPVDDKPQCVCKIQNNGSIIDLTSIRTILEGVENTPSAFRYTFNPCFSLSKCGDDTTTAVCQSGGGLPQPFSCGHTETVAIDIDDDGHFVIQYMGGDDNRMSHVTLHCDPNATDPVFTVKGEQSQLVYAFELTSKCACPDLCSDQSTPTDNNKGVVIHVGGIGIGIISLVIVVAMSYIIVGVVVSIANGKHGTEVIPQKDFWFGVCGLVKDGCVFTFSPICSRTKRMTSGYDKL